MSCRKKALPFKIQLLLLQSKDDFVVVRCKIIHEAGVFSQGMCFWICDAFPVKFGSHIDRGAFRDRFKHRYPYRKSLLVALLEKNSACLLRLPEVG